MSTTTPTGGYRDPASDTADRSIGDLLGEITRDMSTLMRQEVALAKAEVRQEATKAGSAAGMFGGAAIAGYMVLLFASIAVWWGLSNVMDGGWAALIVAAVWAVVGGVLFMLARSRLQAVRGLRQTADTVKEIPDALKGH